MSTFYLDLADGSDSNNGTTWALAWRTFSGGPTAARVTAGDEVKVGASPSPYFVSYGTLSADTAGTFIIISSQQTLLVDAGTGAQGWVGATSCYMKTDNSLLLMNANADIVFSHSAAFTTGLMFYKSFGSAINATPYKTFNISMTPLNDFQSGWLRFDLCSDTAGTVIVNSMVLNEYLPANYTYSIHLESTKTFGPSINSIGIQLLVDTGILVFYVNDMYFSPGSTNNNIDYSTLVAIDSSPVSPWMIPQFIVGNTLRLSWGGTYNYGRYNLTASNCRIFARRHICGFQQNSKFTINAAPPNKNTFNCYGSGGRQIIFNGGYDKTTSSNTEKTFFAAHGYYSQLLYASSDNIYLKNFGFANNLAYVDGNNCQIENCDFSSSNLNLSYTLNYMYNIRVNSISLCNSIIIKPLNSRNSYFETASGFGSKIANSIATAVVKYGFKNVNFKDYYIMCPTTGAATIPSSWELGGEDVYNSTVINTGTGFSIADNKNDTCLYNCSGTLIQHTNRDTNPNPVFIENVQKVSNTFKQTQITFKGMGSIGYTVGVISDQVTGGQSEAWTYGSAGKCIYFSPAVTHLPLTHEFYVPVSSQFTLQFYHRVTTAFVGTAQVTVIDPTGSILVNSANINTADNNSWNLYQSDTLTTGRSGFAKVKIDVYEGITSGDLGIDEISVI